MISDKIENRALYSSLSPRIKAGLDYLGTTNFSVLDEGRYDIDGDNVFALVQEYKTISREEAKWECHQNYIDIQFIVEGTEQIGFGSTDKMEVMTQYNSEMDIAFLKGEGDYATLTKGCFGVYFPQDAHKPKVTPGNVSGQVKKVVVKIKVS